MELMIIQMVKLLGVCIGLFGIVLAIGGPIYNKMPWREAIPIYLTVPVFVFSCLLLV